jgi:hypothetical protein
MPSPFCLKKKWMKRRKMVKKTMRMAVVVTVDLSEAVALVGGVQGRPVEKKKRKEKRRKD